MLARLCRLARCSRLILNTQPHPLTLPQPLPCPPAQDCSELVLTVTAAWAALDFKSSAIGWQVAQLQTDT